jgi:hypothetical protein
MRTKLEASDGPVKSFAELQKISLLEDTNYVLPSEHPALGNGAPKRRHPVQLLNPVGMPLTGYPRKDPDGR